MPPSHSMQFTFCLPAVLGELIMGITARMFRNIGVLDNYLEPLISVVWIWWLIKSQESLGYKVCFTPQGLHSSHVLRIIFTLADSQAVAIIIPVFFIFGLSGAFRRCISFESIKLAHLLLQIVAAAVTVVNLARWFWALDLPLTYTIHGEPVYYNGNVVQSVAYKTNLTQVGTIKKNYDKWSSRLGTLSWQHDLCIAKFNKTQTVNDGRVLSWNKEILDANSSVYIVGGETTGLSSDGKALKILMDYVEVALGGWRITLQGGWLGKYGSIQSKKVLLWRSPALTVAGFSGGMLVTPGTKLDEGYWEWRVVGFQSYEITVNEDSLIIKEDGKLMFWKIALLCPQPLTKQYFSIAPHDVLKKLDLAFKKRTTAQPSYLTHRKEWTA